MCLTYVVLLLGFREEHVSFTGRSYGYAITCLVYMVLTTDSPNSYPSKIEQALRWDRDAKWWRAPIVKAEEP